MRGLIRVRNFSKEMGRGNVTEENGGLGRVSRKTEDKYLP